MRLAVVVLALLTALGSYPSLMAEFVSHPPSRPLSVPNDTPLPDGPTYFVDSKRGDDQHSGSREKPWKSLSHAIDRLRPGDTLCLRGGVYHERVTISTSGTPEKPITIRSFPGELAILDGGLADFLNTPTTAWEPCPNGVPGEFRSVKMYPTLGTKGGVNLLGSFGDSMVPLQGYRFLKDLRDPSMVWDVTSKVDDTEGVYCGPGVWYDVETGRIHVRLAHTNMAALGDDNYRGETDPRRVPLIIGAANLGPALSVQSAHDLRIEDLVVRGSATATVDVTDSSRLVFDGLTVYGGRTAFRVVDTAGFRLLNTACRGIAAPWTFRGHLKYRSTEAKIFTGGSWEPSGADSRDFELAHCEFTDCVDGVFVGNVRGVYFHHNLLDNISDDGLFLTAATGYDGVTPGGDIFIYQNVLSRCLTTLAFGVGHGRQKVLPTGKQTGSGVWVYRNVFDYRRPVMYQFPVDLSKTKELPSYGRFASDHGSPTWEPMRIYQNTFLAADRRAYPYGTAGLGDHTSVGTVREVFNNLIVQTEQTPGATPPKDATDWRAGGNLFWSMAKGAPADDPRLVRLASDWHKAVDMRLRQSSPAIDAGDALPDQWPDPIRSMDKGARDIGALPFGAEPWRVGVRGRLSASGTVDGDTLAASEPLRPFTAESGQARPGSDLKPVAIVLGYPELDGPILAYLLRKRGVRVELFDRAWLDTQHYERYSMVILAGDLRRAAIEHHTFTLDDLSRVQSFVNQGGTLMVLRRAKRALTGIPEGKKLLEEWAGTGEPATGERVILQPSHAWVRHLDADASHPWLETRPDRDNPALSPTKGESIVGVPRGSSELYRVPIGKGQFIYHGWSVGQWIPSGRAKTTPDQDRIFEEQVGIFAKIVESVSPRPQR